MKIYVYDHTGSPGVPALEGFGALVKIGAEVVYYPKQVPSDSLAIVHAGTEELCQQVDWEKVADLKLRRFIVFVSSNPGGVFTNVEACFACKRPLSEIVASGDVRKMIDALKEGVTLDRYLSHADESAIHSLWLLCEAWVMNGGEATSAHNGIVIHAPVYADDWFAPFVVGFRRLESDKKRVAANKWATKISEMMGVAQSEALTLYERLATLYESPTTEVSKYTFDAPIKILCDRMRRAKT